MSEEYGPNFVTLTDEEGNDIELEYIDALEHNGTTYMAFLRLRNNHIRCLYQETSKREHNAGVDNVKYRMENRNSHTVRTRHRKLRIHHKHDV